MIISKISDFLISNINLSINRLFYPHVCLHCGFDELEDEHQLCYQCKKNIPKTGYFNQPHNLVEQLFWGKVPIQQAGALYFFTKNSILQTLIFNLKYNNRPEIGVALGRLLGNELKNSSYYSNIDMLIPLPLHTSRIKKRGYNQAEKICEGIQQVFPLAINNTALIRIKSNKTQTKENRVNRWMNSENIFQLTKNDTIKNKSILLVDDVITTGATLESASQTLINGMVNNVSLASIAFTIMQ